jgi:hypothetical protein
VDALVGLGRIVAALVWLVILGAYASALMLVFAIIVVALWFVFVHPLIYMLGG